MSLPAGAQLVAPVGELAFLHCGRCRVEAPITALEAWRRVMAQPLPGMAAAFWLRDAIASRFGVARIGGFRRLPVGQVAVGDHLDFFTVEAVRPDLLSLTSRDRHLDVMTCITVEGLEVAITASVKTHNLFGRLYMLPVCPAHRLIVWATLRRIAKPLR